MTSHLTGICFACGNPIDHSLHTIHPQDHPFIDSGQQRLEAHAAELFEIAEMIERSSKVGMSLSHGADSEGESEWMLIGKNKFKKLQEVLKKIGV